MSARHHTAAPIPHAPDRAAVWRKCACGATSPANAQSCPACQRKKLQPKLVIGSQQAAEEREADRVADAVMRDGHRGTGAAVGAISSAVQRSSAARSTSAEPQAPPIVDRVLGRSGQPLDPTARHFFERRFERDFSNVRVHADAEAAASARAVDAHAYTVGNHLVFGASRYAPDTVPGRRLLAHELTHVVQQDATLRRLSISPLPVGTGDRVDEDEQPVQRLQRHPAIVGPDEAGPKADLTGASNVPTESKAATADFKVCDPETPPGWDSFNGPVPPAVTEADKQVGALTSSILKGSFDGSTARYQGVFLSAKSWVRPRARFADDPFENGLLEQKAACESHFARGNTDGWSVLPGKGCPAGIVPRGDKAMNAAECSTIMAKDYTEMTVAESKRLLKHEHGHFAITCIFAKKMNAALAGGKTFAQTKVVGEGGKLGGVQTQYDDETDHGCKAGPQATWDANIAKGLPALKLF
jgi:hypothetical protein